ncbi:DNA gyrase subunit A [Lachnospiraceae bacterium]|nr:DNA gyrase subunit A [Lachnospiraceae bacterium]
METIKTIDYEEEMGQDYVDYAMSVITERALPDVKDGLKPVQRRIIYSLSELTKSDSPHRKCARIVGDTMGKYHPHGDSSIYEGLVNLAQSWKLPIPLVDPHGNFGDVSGSGAAAMRYTEARISKYAEEGLKDLKFCEFMPNFDGTETEPVHIPFLVPNMLTSGATGIAVGMATNIPTHNLEEIADAEIAYLENPDITTEELLGIVKGPDFATGGIINADRDTLLQIYETGLGRIRVRGKVEIRDAGRGRRSICVTEIPFTMIGSTEKFLNTVADLVRQGKLPAVVDIADRGDKDGECLAIDVKKGTTDEEIDKILNILYKKAGLEDSYSVNMNCIYNKKPEVMGLKRVLETYTEYKWEVYTAKYERLLADQKDVREVKSGLLEAVDVIDLIIEILRGSATTKEAKECLMYGKTDNIKFRYKGSIADAQQLHFTEKQTDAILAMRLQKLIGLEVDILMKELEEAEKKIAKFEKLLKSRTAMKKQMISDIEELKKKYAIPRKTVIENLGEIVVEKEKVVATEETILLDRFFYIKSAPRTVYEKNKESINSKFELNVMSTDRVAIFDSEGMVHIIKVSDILKKQTKKDKKFRITDKGIQVFEFCGMSHTSDVVAMMNVSEMNPLGNLDSDTARQILLDSGVKEADITKYAAKSEEIPENIKEKFDNNLIFVTVEGKAKRASAALFDTSRKTSQAMKAGLVYVDYEGEYVVAETENGYSIKVRSDELPVQGKGAGGVTLISLRRGDHVASAVTGGNEREFNGISLSDMKAVKRGGKGNKKGK